tara:strand:- start:50 stop:400 length:351 start_codon:yes stop_codon:yes gene_type:complete
MNDDKPANKKEVTAACEALNEENERLIRKINALEKELIRYRGDNSLLNKIYEHCMWWYDYHCAVTVNKFMKISLLTVAGLGVTYYVIASLGMEFFPNITEPVTDFIKRAVGSLLPW